MRLKFRVGWFWQPQGRTGPGPVHRSRSWIGSFDFFPAIFLLVQRRIFVRPDFIEEPKSFSLRRMGGFSYGAEFFTSARRSPAALLMSAAQVAQSLKADPVRRRRCRERWRFAEV